MTASVDKLFLDFQAALAGRYSLERELGRGGMGVVYLAREVRLDRLVAIKVLPPEHSAHAPMRERFLREARTAAALSHPHIIPIYAVDEVGLFVFYAMAFVDGETLARRVAARGPVPSREACRVLREVAWALAYAHEKGIVHRDVKPENIILEAGTGRALVADFGIARVERTSGGTGVGEVIGTPAFMSPEQASAEEVDGRSDIYSLGVVAYYALSGRVPFEGKEVHAVLAQHLTLAPPPLATVAPGVPHKLAYVVQRCLAKDRHDRFGDGRMLAEALEAALEPVRELPTPLRAFVRFEMQSGLGWGIVTWPTIAALLCLGAIPAALASGVLHAALQGLAMVGVMLGGGVLIYTRALRRLLRVGYGRDDVLRALEAQYGLRLEERAFEVGTRAFGGRVLRLGLRALVGAGVVATVIAAALGRQPQARLGVVVSLFLAIAAWASTEVRRNEVWLNRSMRIWRGAVGRWLFRLASFGLRATARENMLTDRPTEMAIGLALGDLYRRLPDESRRALADLPDVSRRLEQHAQELRARLDQLDRLLVEAGQAPRVAGATGQRDQALEAMRATRAATEQRRGDVVRALESLRLGLLRLHAGAGTVGGVTADLAAARALGTETGRLVAARRDVEATLDPAGHAHA